MKRCQLLLTLFGGSVASSLIYGAIAKSKDQYEPVLAKSPASNPPENNPTFTDPTEEPLVRFAAIADNGFGSSDQICKPIISI
ncbi:MAG: hypothetical protein ACK6CP_16220 [Pseudanabaena sp.]|jgi:hypothetical protein|nr:hypothetical protein [Pseudanabaena sp. M090S1SP2A07QC]MCA6508241.1 hypothetical protein [Pseudanabaena sp. M172S2SP2A07QC]MCA6510739.1 hypothetical protein [Pseudanabaena sp. M109S1SP2A07QC]MCA6519662.1 hypothetical protein [Pseudanabaena sp. M110S1SP2A07QC]MCA6521673.1 hypothetical protein [Pseudanabaena sp. M051S1SP2A07QC]MCA6527725.1 hypothetical protein [Pseudanabaena sp. M179S2SP2A07QC]MCA6530509.1 hypothetical protein [Pseudanabaena sp. M125S2SP2A07QC]MCA6535062.1 hypothetical prot